MSGIGIFDTEVFTGSVMEITILNDPFSSIFFNHRRIEGPVIHRYEFEFTQLGVHGEHVSAKRPLTISHNSKFMVPLPAEIDPEGTVVVSLNDIESGRTIFVTDVPLGKLYDCNASNHIMDTHNFSSHLQEPCFITTLEQFPLHRN